MLYCSYVKMHKGALTMKIKYLLMGTSLSLIPQTINAQCVATQDCATLGYTETSCSGGSGVKCPFGNKWACFKSESEICNDLGFTLTCTGTNQTGGGGKACNGKYSECTCTSGYIWNDSSQKCEDLAANCTFGSLYYTDGTCSNDYVYSKKLLGIVIYEKSAGQNGWVMTHKPVATGIRWSYQYVDISGVLTTSSESSLTDIQASCTNTDKITAQGDSSKYPVAWAAKNYKEGDKTWCLPSGGLLRTALNNSDNFTKFNNAIKTIQTAAGTSVATILGNAYSGEENVWSSSESDYDAVWNFSTNTSGSFRMGHNLKYHRFGSSRDNADSVRPVMPF